MPVAIAPLARSYFRRTKRDQLPYVGVVGLQMRVREAGVALLSAPVFDVDGTVAAAVSVSGPIDRLTRTPGKLHSEAVVAAVRELTQIIGG